MPLTSQVFSSRAPVSLESIVSNLSSHITIPVAITTVQKHGTLKTKIANDSQSDVRCQLIRSANTVENENPVQHGILCCKQGTCPQELSRIVRLAAIEWFGHWYAISYLQKVQKLVSSTASVEQQRMSEKVHNARFLCMPADGSTDKSTTEQGAVDVLYTGTNGRPTTVHILLRLLP